MLYKELKLNFFKQYSYYFLFGFKLIKKLKCFKFLLCCYFFKVFVMIGIENY